FGLPLLARLDLMSPDTQALVIVPTRELAIQVADEINKVGGHLGVLVSAIYGGTKMDSQMTDLAWSSIIVGTPGRLRDHLTRGNLYLEKCHTVVLDEADEMLDMGFKDDLEFILGGLPKPRLTLLFSATFPRQIEMIARKYMVNAEKIAVSSGLVTPTDITHRFLNIQSAGNSSALVDFIRAEKPALGLVFCDRKSETTSVARKLKSAGIRAGFLNGDMDQSQRIVTLDQFRKGAIDILVATDVAARGLDISGISHVINISVPHDTESYVHRSGRTGRAGNKGVCVTMVAPEDYRYFAKIKHDLGVEICHEEGEKKEITPEQAKANEALKLSRRRPEFRSRRPKTAPSIAKK
ncbi:MAG TPA: DEAD/DEAH box helicase, partial [Chroococcales cyanobacterium]